MRITDDQWAAVDPCPSCEEWRAIAENAIRTTERAIANCRYAQAMFKQALANNDRLLAMLRVERGK